MTSLLRRVLQAGLRLLLLLGSLHRSLHLRRPSHLGHHSLPRVAHSLLSHSMVMFREIFEISATKYLAICVVLIRGIYVKLTSMRAVCASTALRRSLTIPLLPFTPPKAVPSQYPTSLASFHINRFRAIIVENLTRRHRRRAKHLLIRERRISLPGRRTRTSRVLDT